MMCKSYPFNSASFGKNGAMQLNAMVLQRLAVASIPIVAHCFFVKSEKRVCIDDSLLLLLMLRLSLN
jgi:hypothetical protein